MFYFSFERELKNKLSEKTRGAQSEAQVLMKAFKYFDLNDNGVVEPDEFAKAIEKIGIQIPTRQVSHQNFSTADIPICISTGHFCSFLSCFISIYIQPQQKILLPKYAHFLNAKEASLFIEYIFYIISI